MELQRQVQRFDMRGSPQDAGDARNLPLEYLAGRRCGDKDNRHVWKQFGAMLKRELHRRRAVGNQRVERTIAELHPDVIPQRDVRRHAKFFVLQELGVVIDLDSRM